MNFIEPTVREIVQEPGLAGMMKHIDLCAGICYNRESAHRTLDEQNSFVQKLIKLDHGRALEFGTVYLHFTQEDDAVPDIFLSEYNTIRCAEVEKVMHYYVTTNYRYILDYKLDWVLPFYMCEPTQFHKLRKTVLFHINRSVADEFRTHVTLSSLMLSTRYAKYNDFDVIKPYWFDKATRDQQDNYRAALLTAQSYYNVLIDSGMSRQDARGILPMDAATKLIMCGFVDCDSIGWKRFINMRNTDAAQPDARRVAQMVQQLLNINKDDEADNN